MSRCSDTVAAHIAVASSLVKLKTVLPCRLLREMIQANRSELGNAPGQPRQIRDPLVRDAVSMGGAGVTVA